MGASLNVRVKLFDLNMLEAEHFEMIYPTLCYRGPNLQISICTCDYRCYAVMYKSDVSNGGPKATIAAFRNMGHRVSFRWDNGLVNCCDQSVD